MTSPRLLVFLILLACSTFAWCESARAGSVEGTIPRSSNRKRHVGQYPPWRLSSKIDDDGFLIHKFDRCPGDWEETVFKNKKEAKQFDNSACRIRQVPGDGNCLFHAVSCCYEHAVNGNHVDLRVPEKLDWLHQHSAGLRENAMDCLENRRKPLFLQGREYLRAKDLVHSAAAQYDISGKEYCRLMRQDSYWGGGPEIVALCNVLQRPIHVYELHDENGLFLLKRMASFGYPKFDRQSALHILSADSRFPDVQPGHQLQLGNHFLAVFPQDDDTNSNPRLRGGDVRRQSSGDEEEITGEDTTPPSRRLSWWLPRSFLGKNWQ